MLGSAGGGESGDGCILSEDGDGERRITGRPLEWELGRELREAKEENIVKKKENIVR